MSDNVVRLPGPKLHLLGQAIAYTVPSNSRRGLHHIVLIQISRGLSTDLLPEAEVVCSCEGFQWGKKCWHSDRAMGQLLETLGLNDEG